MARYKPGDRVVRDRRRWRASEFDAWGSGRGVGVVVDVPGWTDDAGLPVVDVRWPTGRAWAREDELRPARWWHRVGDLFR